MIIYLSLLLTLAILFCTFAARKKRGFPNTFIGEWYCHYHHPYVWANKEYDKLALPAEYIIRLYENGTGEIRLSHTPEHPAQSVHFTWIYEQNYLIVDHEDWDKSLPVYFKVLEFDGEKCRLEVSGPDRMENQIWQQTLATQLREE